MQEYIVRVNDVVNQMRGLGDQMPEPLVVRKILRSLGPKYNLAVAAIGEAKDLTKLTMDELASSLQAHEALLLSHDDNFVEKAFVVKPERSKMKTNGKFPAEDDFASSSTARGRGRGMWRGKGFHRGRRRNSGQRQGPGETKSSKSHIHCFN